jgi:hypothetical protein
VAPITKPPRSLAALDPSDHERTANPTLSKRMSKISKRFVRRLRRWRRGGRWARRKLAEAPRAVRIGGVIAILLATLMLTNLIYHVIHKPTELFFFVGHKLDKEPAETWRQYGRLFHAYSTSAITPELLAALAQVESSGNPVDRTYWRWRFSFNPFAIYQPASSAVGLFQMTDPAYSEAARFCIRANTVENAACRFGPYIRAIPSHAVELASVYLDRKCRRRPRPSGRCGGQPATDAGSRRLYPSLRRRSRHRLRTPSLSDHGGRTVRRSSRRGLHLKGQRDEAAVLAPWS